MAKGREYAEGLVGPLDRSYYETQRNVATKTSETNWEDLQNQYKNLQNKLKAQQEQANRDFANGLVQVAENSMNRMNNANEAMARSGLTQSGLNNLMQQSDTTKKGEEVLRLLGKSGDIAVNIANQLGAANTNMTKKQANLADDLADTLGEIGARDTSAQMAYNSGLANLGEAMEAREAENELEAARRAASASSGSGKSKEDEELDEFYRRLAIKETLTNDELTDLEKKNTLGILYGINNGENVVNAYNTNIGKTREAEEKKYKKSMDAQEKELNKLSSPTNTANARKVFYGLEDKVKDGKASKSEKDLYNYLTGGDTDMTFGEAQQTYFDLYAPDAKVTSGKNNVGGQFDALMYLYNPYYSDYGAYVDNLTEYNEFLNQGITYEELAELLYGSK